jgi:hypothetical protein
LASLTVNAPAVALLPAHPRDRGLRLVIGAHLDEAEALRSAGLPVVDDFRAADVPCFLEHRLQVRAGDGVA